MGGENKINEPFNWQPTIFKKYCFRNALDRGYNGECERERDFFFDTSKVVEVSGECKTTQSTAVRATFVSLRLHRMKYKA